MAFVNKTMLHIDHSELHSLQQETSWEALPEEARTLSVAAVFLCSAILSALRTMARRFSSRYVHPVVGVDLGFNMTQRFIAVDDNVLSVRHSIS